MDDHDDLKLVPFRGKREPVTPVELLIHCLQECREFPVKHAFVILFDEDDEPSFWGTNMTKAQSAKCLMDHAMHVQHAMLDSVTKKD